MLSRDFKEFVALLNAHGVDYLIVGGYAMALHGRPRNTGDLDVWIDRDTENAARLMQVLEAFGFGGLGLSQQDFETREHVVQLGYPPFRIDLLTDIDGVEFAQAWPRRETITHKGVPLQFIGLEDLKANKRSVGRPRDLDDLDQLP
ncbi:MAG: nucleotidyltransferase [Burkholderiaceae bacterium]|nr:nucleotidyltransferase [Sulfuritalea sp.]MCF8175353.1 nucleotidyltransferase [Burkholderiaceae bacterium]